MRYPSHLGRARRRRLHALTDSNDSVRYFSSYVPGGIFTMIALARLSADERVRQAAFAWNALPRAEHRTVNLDRLCWDVGLSPGSVLGSIAETAFELGMDVSELMSGLAGHFSAIQAEIARARAGRRRDLERFFRSSGFLPDSTTRTANREAADPDSELEPIEEDTIEFTRMLKRGLQRGRRRAGRR